MRSGDCDRDKSFFSGSILFQNWGRSHRGKKSSEFFEVNYLSREDTFAWLSNLEGHSKISDYSLTQEDAEKIWDTVGGSMWEINAIFCPQGRSMELGIKLYFAED